MLYAAACYFSVLTWSWHFPCGHYLGLTFFSEGDLSSDRVDEEHVTGGNSGCLFHEAEPQLSVDGAALIAIQRLHLHKRDPWNTVGFPNRKRYLLKYEGLSYNTK